MEKNELLKIGESVFRILGVFEEKVLAIDCMKKVIPCFLDIKLFENAQKVETLPCSIPDMEDLTPAERAIAQERFTMIAGALSVLEDEKMRSQMIDTSARHFKVSKQTIRAYLCKYLIYKSVEALAPEKKKEKELTRAQMNMRWALNKFFYTRNQNSLQTAYTMMLKEKYCDANGALLPEFPSFNQFRYFYRKTRKTENYYISRDGIKDYQRNKRPLLGDGVQEFAPCIGTAMLDGTICDIYLVDEMGQLVGRPILVAACDANTSMCMGYSLLLEGGTYSLQNLMLNILEDKVSLCERMGIKIQKEQWDVCTLPRIMITDGGAEYKGQTFEQISELGITLVNLPPYRPDLKGNIEKLFDLIQTSYKDVLKGKGVIMPDFRERGAHDYRKDAVLTLHEFEKIIVRCIVYYNCERVVKNYPYTPQMLEEKILPHANEIWNYKKKEETDNLISISSSELILTLLQRTKGRFTHHGLRVNGLRYFADGYKEKYLNGGEAIAAYNPDDCSKVWIKEKDNSFVKFGLIERRFADMPLAEVKQAQEKQRSLEKVAKCESYASKIELLSFIETASQKDVGEAKINGVRNARKSAKINYTRISEVA